jgi:hypothetical protein
MVELDDEKTEIADEPVDIEHNDDDERKLDIEVLVMLEVSSLDDEMVVEVIELDDDDDGGDEMVQLEIVVLGTINELVDEADMYYHL